MNRVAMDCRRFHKDLEDYLEETLDFKGRFGLERHAERCIPCAKVLSNAQQLRRMARQLEKVKAPANFEQALLNEIGRREAHGRFWGLKKYWLYGFEMPPLRRLALAASCIVVLGVGSLYLTSILFNEPAQERPSATVVSEPAKTNPDTALKAVAQPVAAQPAAAQAVTAQAVTAQPVAAQPVRPTLAAQGPRAKRVVAPERQNFEQMVDQEVADADYVEFQMIGPDNQPVTFRWPTRPRIRNGQTLEENFLRNVSH